VQIVVIVFNWTQVEVIDDAVQRICQQIRALNFTAVLDNEKKECKKRNLIKEELVALLLCFKILHLLIVSFFVNTVTCFWCASAAVSLTFIIYKQYGCTFVLQQDLSRYMQFMYNFCLNISRLHCKCDMVC